MERICAKELKVGYGDYLVIDNLSLKIPDKKITAIIGANGCGKSTLLKTLTRIIKYSNGHVLLDGKEIKNIPTKEIAKKIAILPQTPEGAEGLTVEELVSYGRFPYQSGFGRMNKHDLEMVDWAMEVTSTKEFSKRKVDELSGGQKQRVWIAMALAQETEIIFLDEPTTYLDLAHQLEVLTLLQELNVKESRTIIMVLHDINQASKFADYLIGLKDGKIVKAGDCNDVMTKETLREIFNIEVDLVRDRKTNKPLCLSYNLL